MKFKLSKLFTIAHFGLFIGILLIFLYWQYSTIKEFHNIQLKNFFNQTNNIINILIEREKTKLKDIIISGVEKYTSSNTHNLVESNNIDFIFSTNNNKITDIYGYSLLADIEKIAYKLKQVNKLNNIIKLDIDSKPYYVLAHKAQIIDDKFGKVKGELWGVIILNDHQFFIDFLKESAKVQEIILVNNDKNIIASTLNKKLSESYLELFKLNKIEISNNKKYISYTCKVQNDLNILYLIDNSYYNNIYEKFISKAASAIIILLILGIVLYFYLQKNFIQKLTELKYFIQNNIINRQTTYKHSKIEELDDIAHVFEKLFSDFKLEKERFDLAMKSTKDGLWDWNPKTQKVFFSQTWKSMLGYKEDEISNEFDEWEKRVHLNDIKKTLNDIQLHLDGKSDLYENIHRMKHKKGHWIWIYARGKALFDKEGAYRIIGFNTDISAQREKEIENIKKDKLIIEQSKNAQMGEMIGNIAHQWRQPLNAISTAASTIILKKEYEALNDLTLKELANSIIKSTQYLSKTIDTFRDYIKEEKVYKETILQNRINYALSIIEASLKNNHIELINNISKVENLKIKLVTGELSQVIINIINNAKDAIISNNIDNGWIEIELEVKNNHAIITIEDNAGGIDENIIHKIFDPYFTTKHQSQGTGLGLHMSKEIITKHMHGKLYLKNSVEGAKFFIELPL